MTEGSPVTPTLTVADAPAPPVTPSERIVPLDVLRGVALLGILLMNIRYFSMIGAAYDNPTAYGDLHGANYAVWYVTALLADTKFMAIFSMLFGAGIVLMAQRQEKAGRPPWRVHLRRMLVLLAFGVAHAWLLWAGDILYTYALCGLAVFWFRHASPRSQILLGLLVLTVGSVLPHLAYQSGGARVDLEFFRPSEEEVKKEVAALQGNWWRQCDYRWPAALYLETIDFAMFLAWRAGGLMLVGMAFFRLGLFNATHTRGLYVALLLVGIFIGLPLIARGVYLNEASGWDPEYVLFQGMQYNYWGSLLVAMGWVGLVMLVCQSPLLKSATHPLAAVGRTALSNYFFQTLACTTIFYGHGLGLFGRVERVGQMGIVAAVWLVQLVVSPLWLRHFRFGPAEWLWRSLTYGKWQPLRNPSQCAPDGSAAQPSPQVL
jgi:uncharacterized protein